MTSHSRMAIFMEDLFDLEGSNDAAIWRDFLEGSGHKRAFHRSRIVLKETAANSNEMKGIRFTHRKQLEL